MTIEEIMARKEEMLEQEVGSTCHSCGRGEILCEFDDGEPTFGDSCFDFTHRCSYCNLSEIRSHTIGNGYDEEGDYVCDFCGHNWSHDLYEYDKLKASRNKLS